MISVSKRFVADGVALAALSVGLAVALTGGGLPAAAAAPAAAPFWVAAAVLIAAFLVLERLPTRLDFGYVVAVTLLAEQVMLLEPGMPWGHDAPLHAWAAAAWTRELLAGSPFPFWLHALGAGVPFGQFYPPLGYAVLVPLHAVGLELGTSLRFTFVLLAVVGALGTWHLVRGVAGDRRAALLAAAAFAFAPYRLYDAHVRSALGQAAATAVLPFLFLALGRAWRRRGTLRLAVATAALLVAHLLTATLAVYGALAWFAGLTWTGWRVLGKRWWPTARRLILSAALAAALASPYLWPLLADLDATSVARVVPVDGTFLLPGIGWRDVVGWRTSGRRIPVPVGAVLCAGLAVAAARLRGASPRLRGALAGSLAAAGLGLWLASDIGSSVTARLPGLRVLQFPWRALTLTAVLGSVAFGLAFARRPGRHTRWLGGCALLALIAEGRHHAAMPWWVEPWSGLAAVTPIPSEPGRLRGVSIPSPPRRLVGSVLPPPRASQPLRSGLAQAFVEYSNPHVFALQPRSWGRLGVSVQVRRDGSVRRLRARPYASWNGTSGARRSLPARVGGGRIRVEAPAAGIVTVREQCFPGWLEVSGERWIAASCNREGFLMATVGEGRTVQWRFDAWRPPRRMAVGISLCALAVVVMGLALHEKTARRF